MRVNRRPYVGTIEVSSRPQTDRKSNSRANPVFDLVRHISYEGIAVKKKKTNFPWIDYAHAMNVIDSTTIIIIIIKVIAWLFINCCLDIIYYVRKTA